MHFAHPNPGCLFLTSLKWSVLLFSHAHRLSAVSLQNLIPFRLEYAHLTEAFHRIAPAVDVEE